MIDIKKLTLATAGVLAMGLTACTTEDTPPPGSQTAVTSDPSREDTTSEPAGSTAATEPTTVDPERFRVSGNYIFDYEMQDSSTGTCLVTIDGVTCTGLAGKEIPEVSIPPFDPQHPGAVSASAEGLHYTISEGVPPAPAQLEPGKRLEVGSVTCEVSRDNDVSCGIRDNSFTISGQDRLITTSGKVTDPYGGSSAAQTPEETVEATPGENYGADLDVPVTPGTMCGATGTTTLVKVEQGSLSCNEAAAVIDEYRDRVQQEGSGNAMYVELGGWVCSTPTAGRSAQLRAAEICERTGDAARLLTPAGSR